MQQRAYQQKALDMIRQHWREPVLLVMPTGTGKTVVAAMVVRAALEHGSRVLIVSHTREIVTQTARRFAEAGLPTGVILAGERADAAHPVQVASIQTLARRELPDARVVIVDEAHHATAATYRKLIAAYAGKAALIGLTATPERLDGKGLREVGFQHLLVAATAPDMIEQGYLARPRVFAPPAPTFTQAKARGDYTAAALEEYRSKLHGRVVDHYLKHAPGKKAVAFACNIAHSMDMVERFQAAGVRAAHIDGTTPRALRDQHLAALRAGDIDLLSNCMILGEGWDLPDLEVAILARPTLSLSLHRQQCGRIMRPTPGKQALILDHAGNTSRHGTPWTEPTWSLDGAEARKATVRADLPDKVKFCPGCFFAYTPPLSECPACGEVLETPPSPMQESETELVELVDTIESRLAIYRALVRTAWVSRSKLGWAKHQFKQRFGVWPRGVRAIEDEEYPCTEHQPEVKTYGVRCARCLRELPSGRHPAIPR